MSSFVAPYGLVPPDHRLPGEIHLGPVHLQVSDLARSLEYYERVLGLKRFPEGSRTAVLGDQAGHRALVFLHEHRGAAPAPRRGLLGLFHFAILLPDRASLGRFLTHLAEAGVAAGSADHAVSEALYLRDPDGNGVELYRDKPKAEWPRTAEGALSMITKRLDLDALLAEGR